MATTLDLNLHLTQPNSPVGTSPGPTSTESGTVTSPSGQQRLATFDGSMKSSSQHSQQPPTTAGSMNAASLRTVAGTVASPRPPGSGHPNHQDAAGLRHVPSDAPTFVSAYSCDVSATQHPIPDNDAGSLGGGGGVINPAPPALPPPPLAHTHSATGTGTGMHPLALGGALQHPGHKTSYASRPASGNQRSVAASSPAPVPRYDQAVLDAMVDLFQAERAEQFLMMARDPVSIKQAVVGARKVDLEKFTLCVVDAFLQAAARRDPRTNVNSGCSPLPSTGLAAKWQIAQHPAPGHTRRVSDGPSASQAGFAVSQEYPSGLLYTQEPTMAPAVGSTGHYHHPHGTVLPASTSQLDEAEGRPRRERVVQAPASPIVPSFRADQAAVAGPSAGGAPNHHTRDDSPSTRSGGGLTATADDPGDGASTAQYQHTQQDKIDAAAAAFAAIGPSSPFDSAASMRIKNQRTVMNNATNLCDIFGFETINEYVFMNQVGDGATSSVWVGTNATGEKFALKKIIYKKSRQLPPSGGSAVDLTTVTADPSAMPTPESSALIPPPPNTTTFVQQVPTHRPEALHLGIPIKVFDRINQPELRREVAIMKRLQHPNIVPLYEVMHDAENQTLVLRMKYVPDGTVTRMFADGTCQALSERTATQYLAQISSGLAYLHGRKIVHRDIKPSNLLVERTENGDVVYIGDFGVSEALRAGDETASAALYGTKPFFPPELIRREPYGYPGDVWALGVTYYMMLVGRHPFFSYDNLRMEQSILHEDPVFPTSVSVECKNLIMRMLQKDPLARATLDEVRKSSVVAKHKTRLRVAQHVREANAASKPRAGRGGGGEFDDDDTARRRSSAFNDSVTSPTKASGSSDTSPGLEGPLSPTDPNSSSAAAAGGSTPSASRSVEEVVTSEELQNAFSVVDKRAWRRRPDMAEDADDDDAAAVSQGRLPAVYAPPTATPSPGRHAPSS